MKETTLHLVFVLGLIVYGLALIAMMGKQNSEVANTQMAQARYADMPPAIELRQEYQMAVIYKGDK